MAKRSEIYKCELCGNIIDVVHAASGQLVCCGQPMTMMEAGAVDAALEKHVPAVEVRDGGLFVTVGSTIHPMEDKHYIEWIELIADNKVYRHFLTPGQEPQAFFPVQADQYTVREYCNLHGLWKKDS